MKLEAMGQREEKSYTIRASDRLKLKKKKTNILYNIS